jgi:hypothetical protein
MKTYGINLFRSVKDGIYQRHDNLSWDEIVKLFLTGHTVVANKESLPLFNATLFKTLEQTYQENKNGYHIDSFTGIDSVRRTQSNALEIQLLILDYDDSMSLSDAKERFKQYEYIGYTSFNHLTNPDIHKFRLIFPLITPIPAHTTYDDNGVVLDKGIFYELSESILEFGPSCDPCVLNGIQPYYPPSAPQERIHLAESWKNTGEILDWTTWKKNEKYTVNSNSSTLPRKLNGQPNRQLEPSQLFHHRKGVISAGEVSTKIQNVTCPFHTDKNGTELLNKFESGVVVFYCRKCGTFTMPPEKVMTEKPVVVDEKLNQPFFEIDEPWLDHVDRDWVKKLLTDVKKEVLKDKGYKNISKYSFSDLNRKPHKFQSHILYLPEGAGKSQLALSFLADPPHQYFNTKTQHRNQIIFACKSWGQVIAQYDAFLPKLNAISRTAKIAWSFEGSIYRRFKVKLKRSASRPFDPGKPNQEQTIEEIILTNPHMDERFIRVTWNILKDEDKFISMAAPDVVSVEPEENIDPEKDFFESLDEKPPAIIFTTIASLRTLKGKKDNIPLNWIIWVDDPDADEFVDIKPATGAPKIPLPASQVEINGTRYDTRPQDKSLGMGFLNHRCIYTTTEKVTLKLLEHHLNKLGVKSRLHGERYRLTGGNITLLGTKTVQKKYDAIIPLLAHRINTNSKVGLTLIADGIPAEFNHSTNKGRNDLSNRNILIEISQPHPVQIKTLCDSLGLDFNTNRDQITKDLMLDKLHQAVGRNSGFRTKGFECVVLIDSSKHEYLVENCGYYTSTVNSVVIDRTTKMSRKEKRITDSATPLVKDIEGFLNNTNNYFDDLRKVKADINFVVSSMNDDEKRTKYLIRLLVALTSFTGVRFDHKEVPSNKIWKLFHWIIDNKVPENKLILVLEKYKSEVTVTP